MQTVQNFLERFQKFIPQETKTKRFVIDCVEGIYGITLDKTNIESLYKFALIVPEADR